MSMWKSHSLASLINNYLVDSPDPSIMAYLWNFGSLLALCLVMQITIISMLTTCVNSNGLLINYLYISSIVMLLAMVCSYSPLLCMILMWYVLLVCVFTPTMICDTLSQEEMNSFTALFMNATMEETHSLWNMPEGGIVTISDILSMPSFGPNGGEEMFFRMVDLSGGWKREDVLNGSAVWMGDSSMLLPPDNKSLFYNFTQTVWYDQFVSSYSET